MSIPISAPASGEDAALDELCIFRMTDGEQRIYAVVTHDPERALISDFWVGDFADEASFRAVVEFIAERIESGGYRYWLADLRFLAKGFADCLPWLTEDLMPRVIAAGLEREAVVLPAREAGLPADYDVFGAGFSALEAIGDARVRGFTDKLEAQRWLLSGDDGQGPGPGGR